MLRASPSQESLVRTQVSRYRHSSIVPILLILGAACLTGCSSQGKATGDWAEGAPRNQTYKRVLVVGVSPNLDQRCKFERFLAARIRSESTEAFTSCASVTKREPLTRESIDEAVKLKQADAVVATILVSKEWHLKKGGDMDTRGGGMYKAVDSGWATGYYGAYGVPVIYGEFKTAPSVDTLKGDVEVTTRVFETANATLVYTVDTVAKNLEDRASGLDAVTTPIADRLRSAGLIR